MLGKPERERRIGRSGAAMFAGATMDDSQTAHELGHIQGTVLGLKGSIARLDSDVEKLDAAVGKLDVDVTALRGSVARLVDEVRQQRPKPGELWLFGRRWPRVQVAVLVAFVALVAFMGREVWDRQGEILAAQGDLSASVAALQVFAEIGARATPADLLPLADCLAAAAEAIDPSAEIERCAGVKEFREELAARSRGGL